MNSCNRFNLPRDLSPESFLSTYWQKQPLRMPGALQSLRPTLTSGELAWLATQNDVESRLVFTQVDDGRIRYRVKPGPFENDVLASLPRRNWTLLVQDVEKHLPDFRALLSVVDFIPDWRIDDLMVSFATPGGSVGPHTDNYDVFLCQGEGSREWHLADKAACVMDESSAELKLVRPFSDPYSRLDRAGDVLYLPPGTPHWGIARDCCMTYSIGMRAPSVAELNAGLAGTMGLAEDMATRSSATGSDDFYTDPDLSRREAVPGLISAVAIRRTRKLLPRSDALEDRQIAMVLGSVVTDPKAWLEPEVVGDAELADTLSQIGGLKKLLVHGMSKLAFYASETSNLVFANGHVASVRAESLGFYRDICCSRTTSGNEICANADPDLFRWLLTSGVFDLTELHE